MKTKRISRVAKPEPVTHIISGAAVGPALHKAQLPARFVRPDVRLSAFPWGERMAAWIDGSLEECKGRGKSAFISGTASEGMEACAMLVRTLVLRGRDAVFTTLADLMSADGKPRVSDYLVIAGFYDAEFNKARGCPLSSKESFQIAWMLWRLSRDGTTIIAHTSPSPGGVSSWWMLGAMEGIFDRSENFFTSRAK